MRANNIVGSTTLTDYDLSGNGTFVALDANRQNQAIGKVSMTLGERGMGKAGVAANYLVGIPEFLKAYTMYSLEQIVAQKIGLNYQTYLDLAIRTRYASTTRKVYNVSGNVALLPASIVTGSDGTMSEGFLIFLGAYMDSLLIPRKSNGNFTIVLNTTSAARLQASMKASNISFRMEDRMVLADAFRFGSDISNPMISGYVGTVGQFDVFQSNAFGVGAAGTEGVRTEVTGPGTLLNRSSYAFGDMAVARAVGMEMQIFQSEITDSGRLQSYGWRSHETTGDLDVDPSNGGDANQQLRVIDVRTLDTPV